MNTEEAEAAFETKNSAGCTLVTIFILMAAMGVVIMLRIDGIEKRVAALEAKP